jgi:hypothetical protein
MCYIGYVAANVKPNNPFLFYSSRKEIICISFEFCECRKEIIFVFSFEFFECLLLFQELSYKLSLFCKFIGLILCRDI